MSPAETATMSVTANGREYELPAGASIIDLLRKLDIDERASGIAVAVDDAVVSRSDWEETILSSGASVEVITATQGG